MVIEWEEFTLTSEPESEIDIESPIVEDISLGSEESQFFHIKENLRKSLLPQWDLQFDPIKFLSTNLLGKIYLKLDRTIPPSVTIFVDELLHFYERKFIEDEEIPFLLTYSLLKSNRLKDLLNFLQIYLTKGKIPLELEIFLIVGGVLSTELPNIILSGDEKNLLNLLYKYKYVKITEAEKNTLYDRTLAESNDEMLGLVFHLFRDSYRGVRRIHPIQERILRYYPSISIEEKLEFLESYKRTGKYLKIYFLMRKIFTNEELREFFNREKETNGKQNHPEWNSENLNEKIQKTKGLGRFDLLTPFELVNGMSSEEYKFIIRKSVFEHYEKFPHSYSSNLAIAIVYFYEKDYNKFLLYSEMGGSLKNYSEFLYLKLLAFLEMGYKVEAEKVLGVLIQKFPNSEQLKEIQGKLQSIT